MKRIIFILFIMTILFLSGCSDKDAASYESASISSSSSSESDTASSVHAAEPPSKIDNTTVYSDSTTFLGRLESLIANDALFKEQQSLSWLDAVNWVLSQDYRDLRQEYMLSNEKYRMANNISGANGDVTIFTAVNSSVSSSIGIVYFNMIENPMSILRIDADIINPNNAITVSEIFEELGEAQVVTIAKDTPPLYDKSPFFEYRYSNLRIRFVLDDESAVVKYILIRPMYQQTGNEEFVPVHDFSEYLFSDDISSLTFEEIEPWLSMPLEEYLSMFGLFLYDTVHGRVPGATISGGSYYLPPVSGFTFVSNLENTIVGRFHFFSDIKSLADEKITIGTDFAKIIDIWGEPDETEKDSISYVRGKLKITFFSEYSEAHPVYDVLFVAVKK